MPMKCLFAVYILAGSLINCFSQGLINFYNTPSTLISAITVQSGIIPAGGPVGEWQVALLTSPVGADTFSFAGVYGTNTTTAGIFTGGAGVAVPGWAVGTARDFAVFGWLANSVIYDPSWLKPDLSLGSNDPSTFGVSFIGTGTAGGVTGSGTVPTLNIFGGPTGIQSGFVMGSPIPEPSNIALAGLGAVLVMFRLRQQRARTHQIPDACEAVKT